jgi:DNA invertase Pin-like site-specific DNA recombinase
MSSANVKPLRFAALIRVSTETQEKKGESLRTQRADIERDVARLGGTVVVEYSGQEHATRGSERRLLDQLLQDATRGRFDAIMVTLTNRWSRDNAKSKEGLEVLRTHGVRFFVGCMELNLFNPQHCLILGMGAEIGEYVGLEQAKSAMENQIKRAQRGVPSCGRLPFGRTFDKETETWGTDPAKKRIMEEVARRYLEGESLPSLARKHGFAHAWLARTLRNRCGAEWVQTFNSKRLNIHETVTLRVPRLLPDKTIQDVRQRLVENRSYRRHGDGKPGKKHLMAGYVFCEACGSVLVFQAHRRSGLNYYRHAHHDRARACPLRPRPCVRADVIEEAVLSDLFQLYGNPAAIERAIKAAVPDCDELLDRQRRLAEDLDRIDRARERILGLVEKDALTDAQAESKLRQLKEREAGLRAEHEQLAARLAEVPDEPTVSCWVERFDDGGIVVMGTDGDMRTGGNCVVNWMYLMGEGQESDRRALIKEAFDIPLPGGKPAGVFLRPAGGALNRSKRFAYEIRGRLPRHPFTGLGGLLPEPEPRPRPEPGPGSGPEPGPKPGPARRVTPQPSPRAWTSPTT